MSNLEDHRKKIKQWREQYGVKPKPPPVFDIKNTRVGCFCCGKQKAKMSRHHTGYDSLFADMRPDDFAARYVEFHPDDVERLCHYHHVRAHVAYGPLLAKLFAEIENGGKKIITKRWCEQWRMRLRKRFYEWAERIQKRHKIDARISEK